MEFLSWRSSQLRMSLFFFSTFSLVVPALGQHTVPTDPDEDEVRRIIRVLAVKEDRFAAARQNYTYRQTFQLDELDTYGQARGRLQRVSDIIFSPKGNRTEVLVGNPLKLLHFLRVTREDEEDLRSIQPFVLTTGDLRKYAITYLGRDQIDELNCFVFAIKPREMLPRERYFSGQIWVDDQDKQIVKSYGRGVGLLISRRENLFSKFETYREQIDGEYWFPTYTRSEDTLHFGSRPQRIRLVITYRNYRRFQTDSRLVSWEEVSQPDMNPAPPKLTRPSRLPEK